MSDLIKKLPDVKLSAEAEAGLAGRIKQGDENARVELVMANLRRSVLYAQRVDRGQIDAPHLVSLCYQELYMAAKRFDPSRQRFFPFSKAGLRGRVYRFWNSQKVVRHQKEQVSLEGLEHPTAREVVEIKGRRAVKDFQLEHEGEWRTATRELMTGEIEDAVLSDLLARDHWEVIRRRLDAVLPEQYWMIIELTYKGRLNFQQIGNLLGISRARVSRCHAEGIEKLRAAIRLDKKLADYEKNTSS